jgi:hypothetical protein
LTDNGLFVPEGFVIHRLLALVLCAFVAGFTLSFVACGGGSSTTATPATTLSPAPGPVPTATPPVASGSCPIGHGDPATECQAGEGGLLDAINGAIDKVVAAHPEYFVLGETRGPGQYRVLNKDGFIGGVLAILQGQGLCAQRTPKSDKVEVKDSQQYSEEYLLVSDRGYIARGVSSCEKTCTPAAFPLNVGEAVARIFVGMFRLRCVPGVSAPPTSSNLLPMGCDALVTMTPKDKDGHNVPEWLHSLNPEFWVRNGDLTVIVLGDVPGEPFNKWIYPKGVGPFSICAAVDGRQTCMNAQVVP